MNSLIGKRRGQIYHCLLILTWAVVALCGCVNGSTAASAPANPNPSGEWVLNLGKRIFLILDIRSASGSNPPFFGSVSRPKHMQTSDAFSFSHVSGPTVIEPIVARRVGTAFLITVQHPAGSTDKETYLFRLKADSHAQLQFQIPGTSLPPMNLVRAHGPDAVSTDWAFDKTYSPDDDALPNPEMKRIFDEDQRVRRPGFNINWTAVNKSDAERRHAAMKLLNTGALHTGEDFTRAAFIFQHGSTPDDYLLAHSLAMIALKKGSSDAVWIAAATLDRYLQSIKQPQIYGTQFWTPKGLPTTQGPYNRPLISDALRHQLGVPSLSDQQAQCRKYDAQRSPAK